MRCSEFLHIFALFCAPSHAFRAKATHRYQLEARSRAQRRPRLPRAGLGRWKAQRGGEGERKGVERERMEAMGAEAEAGRQEVKAEGQRRRGSFAFLICMSLKVLLLKSQVKQLIQATAALAEEDRCRLFTTSASNALLELDLRPYSV